MVILLKILGETFRIHDCLFEVRAPELLKYLKENDHKLTWSMNLVGKILDYIYCDNFLLSNIKAEMVEELFDLFLIAKVNQSSNRFFFYNL